MRIVEQAHLPVAAASHPGMSGKQNEDRYGVTALQLDDGTPSLLAVVADGIGGHRAGEVAAEIAVEHISRLVTASDGHDPLAILADAIRQASNEIRRQAQRGDRRGMGATCACAWVIGQQLYTAFVGDSRIYLIRRGAIHRLTKDHTWVQEAVDQGALQPDQARAHPMAHVIRRHLGSQNTVVPDVNRYYTDPDTVPGQPGIRLQPGDYVVLCTDGLTDLVDDEEIRAAFEQRPLHGAIADLIDLANQRGGHDNITVVAFQAAPEATERRPQALWLGGCLLAGVLALCLVAALLGAWWLWLGGR